jgi:2-aminoadipate transaminase
MSTTSAKPTSPTVRLSRRWHWATGQAISFLMQQAVENPNVISLAAGLVDPSTLPIDETRDVMESLLGDVDLARAALQYGTTQGSERMRKQAAALFNRLEGLSDSPLATRHSPLDPSQIILTTGSQQLLSLVGEVLLDPGDICFVAAPTYFVFLSVLQGLGARTIPIAADENGMRMDLLEQELERLQTAGELSRVKLIYAVSYYENPSGISLSEARRRELVEIAERWSKDQRIFVLEDAAYRELRYDGPDRRSVWSFDESKETVILAQTFSKSFSPGLRVGFGIVPKALVKPICDRKGNEDFGSSHFVQRLVCGVLESGRYDSHVEQVRTSYREKRYRMLAAAEKYFRDLPEVTWVRPTGGLYVWMSLPGRIETGFDSPLFKQATKIDGVMYVPGELSYGGPAGTRKRNQMRLSFGVDSPDRIEEGIRRLAAAVRAVL